jgi:hypothetical protein
MALIKTEYCREEVMRNIANDNADRLHNLFTNANGRAIEFSISSNIMDEVISLIIEIYKEKHGVELDFIQSKDDPCRYTVEESITEVVKRVFSNALDEVSMVSIEEHFSLSKLHERLLNGKSDNCCGSSTTK